MDVEIAFERDIAADVGYAEVLAVVLAADGLMDVDIVVMQLCGGGQGTEKGKKCEGKVFSHRSCSLVVYKKIKKGTGHCFVRRECLFLYRI